MKRSALEEVSIVSMYRFIIYNIYIYLYISICIVREYVSGFVSSEGRVQYASAFEREGVVGMRWLVGRAYSSVKPGKSRT